MKLLIDACKVFTAQFKEKLDLFTQELSARNKNVTFFSVAGEPENEPDIAEICLPTRYRNI